MDCEELTERLKHPNEVFRKDIDTPFIYREENHKKYRQLSDSISEDIK